MTLAPWRSPLSHALHLHRRQPHSRYFQLATLRDGEKPANRTVVFRGFLPDTNQLQIITDSRSAKFSQIQQQPWGEACWYFPKTWEQFRFLGTLTLITPINPDEKSLKLRHTLWHNLSETAREQFTWPAPGQPKTEDFTPPSLDLSAPLDNFCVILLNPLEVDHLILKGIPQQRWRYINLKDNDASQWLTTAINP